MNIEAKKAWEEYCRLNKFVFRNDVERIAFMQTHNAGFEAGQMAKCKSISTDESEAFTKSKGNVDFSMSKLEIDTILEGINEAFVKSMDTELTKSLPDVEREIVIAISLHLKLREEGKQLDSVKAE